MHSTSTIHLDAPDLAESTVVDLGDETPLYAITLGGLSFIAHADNDLTAAGVATWSATLRRLADDLDHQHRVWLDENADTWGRDDSGYFRDCGGYFEHTEECTVGQAIRAARHTLARRSVHRTADDVEFGPTADPEPAVSW